MKTTHIKLGALMPLCLGALLLSSCSSPFAGPDQFDIGLAYLLHMQGQAAMMKAQGSSPNDQAPRPRVLRPLAPLPAATAAPAPRQSLPLPLGGTAENRFLPALADEPASLGGAAR